MANKLPLNESKTKVLTITGKRLLTRIDHDLTIVVNGKQLENVHCAKLLGLEVDQDLTFLILINYARNYRREQAF